ncbi:MAG: T9SS type A sorting domain-containing protein [Bacteroidales bacterium]|nr:T9SS type A sorting domain-containing protein [Bacteroidales bacterium]
MRKLFTLFVAMTIVAMSYGQSLQTLTPAAKMPAKKYKAVERAGKSTELGWLSYGSYLEGYWDAVDDGGGNTLSIDSLGLTDFSDGQGGTIWDHPWVYSIGQTYDFNATFYDDASSEEDISLTASGSLDIDSVYLRAFYFRGPQMTADMIDTIIVGIRTDITEDDEVHFTNIPSSCFYNIDYDFDLGVQSPAGNNTQIFKFPIGEEHASTEVPDNPNSYYLADFWFPVNITNITNKVVSVCYTFKKGYQMGMTDTLDDYSQVHFFTWADPDPLYYRGPSGNYTDLPSRCENLSHGAYNVQFTNGNIDYYYPSFMFQNMHYPQIYLKLGCNDCVPVAVEDMEKENITVYPNPATNKFTVTLAGSEKANIELFNLVGQRVYNGTATDKAEISVTSLRSGVYMLKVSQNGKVYTSKVVVK